MMEITFSESALDELIREAAPGSSLSGAKLLTLLESESEAGVEAAFAQMEEKDLVADISDLMKLGSSGQAAQRLHREEQIVKCENWTDELEASDPLLLYLQELERMPAAEDIAILASKVAAGEDDARGDMVNAMLPRVIEIAKTMTGRGVLLMDLIQEGSLGLWQGVLQYRGQEPESYCDRRIYGAMAKAVIVQALSGGMGQRLRQGMEDYRDVDQKLLGELGRNPTTEEIAEALHLPVAQTQVLADMLLSAQKKQRVDSSLEEKEPEPDDAQAVENTAYFQSRQRILELLSVLPEEDAKLLTLRFGLEGGVPLTPVQAAEKLGITAQQVIEKEAAALAVLRNQQ